MVPQSTLSYLISSGGFGLLMFGLVLAEVIVLVFFLKKKSLSAKVFPKLVLLPACIGLVGIYRQAAVFTLIASAPVTPKPADLARVISAAFSYGFCTLLGICVICLAQGILVLIQQEQ